HPSVIKSAVGFDLTLHEKVKMAERLSLIKNVLAGAKAIEMHCAGYVCGKVRGDIPALHIALEPLAVVYEHLCPASSVAVISRPCPARKPGGRHIFAPGAK